MFAHRTKGKDRAYMEFKCTSASALEKPIKDTSEGQPLNLFMQLYVVQYVHIEILLHPWQG